jgi:hypothetical protein
LVYNFLSDIEKCNNNTEKSSSDNQSETGNTESTNNSTKEIDINVTTELFMKKLWNFTETACKNCSQSNLSEAKIKAKRLKTNPLFKLNGRSLITRLRQT